MVLNQEIKKSDAILAFGSNDIRVADRVAELYKKGYAKYIICSGGVAKAKDDANEPPWNKKYPNKTEAIAYMERLIDLDVPKDIIFLEQEAKNTGHNVLLIKKLIEEKNLKLKSFIIVQKTFAERRILATMQKQWSDADFCISSPQLSYDNYMNSMYMPTPMDEFFVPKDNFLKVMAGDFTRVTDKNSIYVIPQEAPDNIFKAHKQLVKLGYNY